MLRFFLFLFIILSISSWAFSQDYCIKLDGQSGFVDIPPDPNFNNQDNFTLSAWFRSFENNIGQGIVSQANYFGHNDNREGWLLYKHQTNRIAFRPFKSGSGNNLFSDNIYLDSNWHHVTIRVKGGNILMFVDGILQASTLSDTIGVLTDKMVFGKSFVDTIFSHGSLSLDEIAYWGIPLSISDIVDISCEGITDIRPDSLFGYWKLNEGIGNICADSSAAGLNGILVGGTSWVQNSRCTQSFLKNSSTKRIIPAFPNPAHDKINFSLKYPITTKSPLKIYNDKGEEVYKCFLKSNVSSLNISFLPPGNYFFEISSLSGLAKGKFIKE